MTALQEKEFELLKIFLSVCDTMKLTYYMVCGSALGAVKYQGFVPWDDDIDVALPRPDYDQFVREAAKYLPDHVFLQNYQTDAAYPGIGSKLRDSTTTFIEAEAAKLPINHGVYLDIFPLDGYPEDPAEQHALERRRWHDYRRRYTGLVPVLHRDLGLTALSILRQWFGYPIDTAEYCRSTEECIRRTDLSRSRLWCNFANSMSRKEYSPQSHYGEGTWAVFEGERVRIPADYDAYLTQKYGDYNKEVPESEQTSTHASLVDLERPYTDYIGRLPKLKKARRSH